MGAKSQADTTGLAETAAAVAAAEKNAADEAAAEQARAEAAEAAAHQAEQDAIDAQDLAVINGSLVEMVHPDNGTCDLYEVNEEGHLLVPATEVGAMQDHGFVTVVAHRAAGTGE